MSGRRPDTTGRAESGAENAAPISFCAQFEDSFRALWLIAAGVVGNSVQADDVVQEAAIVAFEKYGEFRRGTNFKAWMGQIVRFVALNHLRKHSHQPGRTMGQETLDSVASPGSSSEGGPRLRVTSDGRLPPDQAHFDDAVVRALDSLSETARVCLLLRTIEGLSYAELATLLDIPEGTAMSHVHRARSQMRDRLGEAGYGRSASRRGTA